MRLILILVRIAIACLLSGWILLLWHGIDSWQTGIQQQIDGSRGANSFPYEAHGQSCIEWASFWGFISCAGFTYWCLHRNNLTRLFQ